MNTKTEQGAPQVPGLLSRRASERQAARTQGGPASTAGAPAAVVASAPKEATSKEAASRLAAIQDDARIRTAAAWTAAKTLLPTMGHTAQLTLAKALCSAPTPVVASLLRTTARMAAAARSAEKFEAETGRDLNEFVEDESLLSKLNTEVLSENKAEKPAVTAGSKKADGLPGEKPEPGGDTAPAEPEAAGTPEGTPPAPTGDFTEPPPAGDGAPGAMGDPGAGMDPASPANTEADAATEGGLMDSIQAIKSENQELEQEVAEAGEEALDLAAIFNPEVQADKAQNLANEGDPMNGMDEAEPLDFGPSSTGDMADAGDFGAPSGGMTDADYFKDASGPDPMAVLLGRTAAEVDVPMGDMASHFESDLAGDTRTAETDVEDLFGEVLEALKQPDMTQKRDTEPHMEEPGDPKKLASAAPAKPKSPVRTVGNPTPASRQASAGDGLSDAAIAAMVLGDY